MKNIKQASEGYEHSSPFGKGMFFVGDMKAKFVRNNSNKVYASSSCGGCASCNSCSQGDGCSGCSSCESSDDQMH